MPFFGIAPAISDVTVSEADGSAPFGVTLSKASALPVTVDFTTVFANATAPDYSTTNGTLTIAAGETESEITVQIMDDDLVEAHETFTVHLTVSESNPGLAFPINPKTSSPR